MTPRPSLYQPPHAAGDKAFLIMCSICGGSYLVFIVAMIVATVSQLEANALSNALASPEIRYALRLSLASCLLSTVISVVIGLPLAYILSRLQFRGKRLIETLLDIPIVLPPLVIGICLLSVFHIPPFSYVAAEVVYEIPAIIIAQCSVSCAFVVRMLRETLAHIPLRHEHVALTLGCSQWRAFKRVVYPQARSGIYAAATLAWARSLGEFGPILVFAGATRFHTEVLPTSIYLEMQAGNFQGMLAIALMMIIAAVLALFVARLCGLRSGGNAL